MRSYSCGVDYSCDVVLYPEFESAAARAAYATHAEHIRVKREMGHLRIARYQVDYTVAGAKPVAAA